MATLKAIWLLATFLAIFDNPQGYLGDVLATSFFSPVNNLKAVLTTFLDLLIVFSKHLGMIHRITNFKKFPH